MAEYCDTPQSKERSNREYKVCLNERTILRLLDQDKNLPKSTDILQLMEMGTFVINRVKFMQFFLTSDCNFYRQKACVCQIKQWLLQMKIVDTLLST